MRQQQLLIHFTRRVLHIPLLVLWIEVVGGFMTGAEDIVAGSGVEDIDGYGGG